MGGLVLLWKLFPNIKVLFQGCRMHTLSSASGQSRKEGMPYFNLKEAQRMLQLLRGFIAWECQTWWITVKAEACHLLVELIMNFIVLYVFWRFVCILTWFTCTCWLEEFLTISLTEIAYVTMFFFFSFNDIVGFRWQTLVGRWGIGTAGNGYQERWTEPCNPEKQNEWGGSHESVWQGGSER